ncbi:MAG TPA: carboxypeptidase regulatory-like domain-containing protein [Gemmatimonadaceae bacterium]|nr:carboxypeptidase regulatory-like domain-containing protein [Gemmatimonadaceae bacterium]
MRAGAPIIALALLATFATAARGQTSTPAAPVASGLLSGIVRDVNGGALADVNVTLLGETAATRTDSAGRFALREVRPGGHTTLFRRIGYRSVEYRWVARSGAGLQVAVAMTPLPRQLERVVVEAPGASRRRGTSSIGGTVVDSAGEGVDGADVRLLGGGLSTVTDSAGRFEFQMLAAGPYIVRARRRGSMSATYVMQVADDDNRGITLKLHELSRKASSRDTVTAGGYGITDTPFDAFDRRQRVSSVSSVLGPGDLFRANRASLDLVLQQYRDVASMRRRRSPLVDEGAGSTEAGDCLLVDGRRAVYQPLRSFSSVDVQLVEVFRANAFVDGFVVSQMDALGECRGSMDHHPSYFVLWTRSLR